MGFNEIKFLFLFLPVTVAINTVISKKWRNYVLLAIGFAVVLLGFVLMAGGGSDSPDEFNYAMFSWRRITLAPILVIGGFVIEIYAIMRRYK